MKKIALLVWTCLLSIGLSAQGVHFFKGTWSELIAHAKSQNKLIYLDIYTTWCGPCKMMDKHLFPNKHAGAKYNAHFVNYKIDGEKGEGLKVAATYKVNAYPTNLFIDPYTEKVVYTALGYCELLEFMQRADVALAERKDTLNLKDYQLQYARGKYDVDFLKRYVAKLKRLDKNNDEQIDRYLAKYVIGKAAPETMVFLQENVSSMDSKTFDYLLESQQTASLKNTDWIRDIVWPTFDKAVQKNDTLLLSKLERIMEAYQLYDYIFEQDRLRVRFYQLQAEDTKSRALQSRLADRLTKTSAKTFQQEDENSWKNYQTRIRRQMSEIGLTEAEINKLLAEAAKDPMRYRPTSDYAASWLNTAAWQVFEDEDATADRVKQALTWSARTTSLVAESHPSWSMYADTYAHLLYKSGAKKEAIAQQERAIAVAQKHHADLVEDLSKSLRKMQQD